MSAPNTLLSDSDGSLVNSLHLIRHGQYEAAVQYLANGCVPDEAIPDYPTYETLINRTVGGHTRHTLEDTVRLLYKDQPQYLQGVDFDDMYSLLDPIQDKIAPDHVKAFPGLNELFANLGSAGIKLGIFSSGDKHMIVRNLGVALPELGMVELFKEPGLSTQEKFDMFTLNLKRFYNLPALVVVTSDDTSDSKPMPTSLNLALERLGSNPAESAALGDHHFDMQAAEAAAVPLRIGITHGFNDRETLLAGGATNVVDNLSEVSDLLTQR